MRVWGAEFERQSVWSEAVTLPDLGAGLNLDPHGFLPGKTALVVQVCRARALSTPVFEGSSSSTLLSNAIIWRNSGTMRIMSNDGRANNQQQLQQPWEQYKEDFERNPKSLCKIIILAVGETSHIAVPILAALMQLPFRGCRRAGDSRLARAQSTCGFQEWADGNCLVFWVLLVCLVLRNREERNTWHLHLRLDSVVEARGIYPGLRSGCAEDK